MKTKFLALLLALSLVGMASAQDVKPKRGGLCGGPLKGSFNDGTPTALNCPHIGKVTPREIYEKGFRVVTVQQVEGISGYFYVFIEEQ